MARRSRLLMERKPEGERSRHYHEAWEAKQIYTDAAAVQRLRAWRVWSVVCPFPPPPCWRWSAHALA